MKWHRTADEPRRQSDLWQGKSWPNLMSMALRNEPRPPVKNLGLLAAQYDWQAWYANMKLGAQAVHDKNPATLIFISGMLGDLDLSNAVDGVPMTPGTNKFTLDDFSGYADKLVLELHQYDYSNNPTNCSDLQRDLYDAGFATLTGSAAVQLPMVVTEWGFQQDSTTWKTMFPTCMAAYMTAQQVGWMLWVVGGSYYIRSGTVDYD